jgi:hypothetical protein
LDKTRFYSYAFCVFHTDILYYRHEDQSIRKYQITLSENTAPVANLVRHVQSGGYYARIRVRGKLIWKSLKTDRISAAKLRLGDESLWTSSRQKTFVV